MELLESEGPRPRQARYQAALRPDAGILARVYVAPEVLGSVGQLRGLAMRSTQARLPGRQVGKEDLNDFIF